GWHTDEVAGTRTQQANAECVLELLLAADEGGDQLCDIEHAASAKPQDAGGACCFCCPDRREAIVHSRFAGDGSIDGDCGPGAQLVFYVRSSTLERWAGENTQVRRRKLAKVGDAFCNGSAA